MKIQEPNNILILITNLYMANKRVFGGSVSYFSKKTDLYL